MKTKFIPFLALILIFGGLAFGQKPADKPAAKDNSAYRQYAERVKKGDLDFNFGQFRRAYVEWARSKKDSEDSPARKEMIKAFDAKNYTKAVELAENVVQDEYLNRGLINAMENAYRTLGNIKKADFYKELSLKVGHSLMLSGDGKNAKTAYYVFNIGEEYKVMRELGYAVSSQSLAMIEGDSFDILSGTDEKGNKVELYFNITLFF